MANPLHPDPIPLRPLTVMIVAGEASGDLLGAGLMRALQEQKGADDMVFFGVGGTAMKKEGLKSLFRMDDLSVMGIAEVIPHLPVIYKRFKQLVAEAQARKPDILITIDSPDFSLRLAKKLKKTLELPCVHYVSPQVWAWRRGRVRKMASYIDHVLALFPFEPKIYLQEQGPPCTFVGHPVAERLAPYMPKEGHEADLVTVGRWEDKGYIALLPGSRKGVINRMLPDMLAAYAEMQRKVPGLLAMIPLSHERQKEQMKRLIPTALQKNVHFVWGPRKFDELKKCRAALVTSGTSNLELAMLGIPMIAAYKTGWFTYWLARQLVDVPYISPVNWVAGKTVVKELIQENVTPQKMAALIEPLLGPTEARKAQCLALKAVRQKLVGETEKAKKGPATAEEKPEAKAPKTPSEQAAEIILQYV